MARIPYVEHDQAPDDVQAIYQDLEGRQGAVPNIFKLMAHSPPLLKSFLGFFNAQLIETSLDPILRELAYIKASRVNACDY